MASLPALLNSTHSPLGVPYLIWGRPFSEMICTPFGDKLNYIICEHFHFLPASSPSLSVSCWISVNTSDAILKFVLLNLAPLILSSLVLHFVPSSVCDYLESVGKYLSFCHLRGLLSYPGLLCDLHLSWRHPRDSGSSGVQSSKASKCLSLDKFPITKLIPQSYQFQLLL